MRVGVLAITRGGNRLAALLAGGLAETVILNTDGGVAAALRRHWHGFDGFVCIMAAGIAVRAAAPLLADKRIDPCLVVVDELGRHAINLLAGHLGGGNELARQVAALSSGTAVITTASDVLGLVPLDLWARDQHLVPEGEDAMTRASSILVNTGCLRLHAEVGITSLPPGLVAVASPAAADIVVSDRDVWPPGQLLFRPPTLVLGIGCKRRVTPAEFEAALCNLLRTEKLSRASIRNLASIDLKWDEAGLIAFAGQNGWPIEFYQNDALNAVPGVTPSAAAFKATGAIGVAEPAALLSAATSTLLLEKKKWQNVTMAIARAACTLSAADRATPTT